MPFFEGFMTRKFMRYSSHAATILYIPALSLSLPVSSFAQSWDKESAGVFIFQRDVPTRAAQVVGEQAPPDQVVLTGPDSPFDAVMHIREPLSDLEAGAISGQAPTGLDILLPGTPAAGTNPQDVLGYGGALASSVASATQGTVAQTVGQTTALLNDTTAAITSVLGKLPAPGGF
jgi:hypothetical protein